MTITARERNMRRIFWIFTLICLVLAVYLFIEMRQLEEQLAVLTSPSRPVDQNPRLLRRQLGQTRIMAWAALGGAVLLAASALAAGWKNGAPRT